MNNIAKERKALGLSQAQFAKLFDWRQSRIANYEKSYRRPSLEVSRRIVEKLNLLGRKCSLDDIFPPPKE